MTKSLGIYRRWSDVELQLLVANYADSHTADLAIVLDREPQAIATKAFNIGLAKSPAYMLEQHRNAGLERGFKKGHVPGNKGLRRPGWCVGRMKDTQFKKGQYSGRAAQLLLPIGAVRVNNDGYLDQKISNEPGAQNLRWKAVHRLVWQRAHGPIPPGHIVRFLPGRRTTVLERITPDALELITLAENLRRNSFHNWPKPLAELVQLRSVLTRQINKASKPDVRQDHQ